MEIPILFNTPMVRAIQRGDKWQTRRIVTAHTSLVNGEGISTKRWDEYEFDFDNAFVDPGPSPAGNPGPYLKAFSKVGNTRERIYPRVQVGDLLWVKETYALLNENYEQSDNGVIPVYRADHLTGNDTGKLKWKPSIFMPKKYARLWLEVKRVRIERVQDISSNDCRAEGIDKSLHFSTRYMFHQLWDSINEKRGYGWDANPWVWVYEFEKAFPPAGGEGERSE